MSVQMLEVAGALLCKGGYRSGRAYLGTIKRMHVRTGGTWTAQHTLAFEDARRACERGMGSPEQADPLPLEGIVGLDSSVVARYARDSWPAAGIDAVIMSCAWLLREIETSLARLEDVKLHPAPDGDRGCGWAEWWFPAPQTDLRGRGTKR